MEINKIYNSDCFQLMKNIDEGKIDLVLTDPPYLFNRGGGKNYGTEGKSKIANTELYSFGGKMMLDMGDFDKDKIYCLLNECKRVCKVMKGYFFCNETALQYYLTWATENNFKYNIITFEKPLSILNRNRYSTNSEFCVRIVAKNGAGLNILDYKKLENNIEWLNSVQKFNKITDKIHLAQKPIEVLEGIIKLNTNEKDLVLDCFSGVGSVAVACINTNRNYIGIEKDEEYYNLSLKRIKKEKMKKRLF